MRAPARVGGFLYAAMLASAAAGRLLDAGALLPGVRESAFVRGGRFGWLTALVVAAAVAGFASRRWSRTGSLQSVATIVGPGQLATFFAAEAVARVTNGMGPLDADGILGAGLQAALALLLLLTMTAAWIVVRTAPLELTAPQATSYDKCPGTPGIRPVSLVALLLARGPPSVLCP